MRCIMRNAGVLIVLLLAATGLATAAVVASRFRAVSCGLAVGQILLAVAALFFLRGRLWLRTLQVAAVLVVWIGLLSTSLPATTVTLGLIGAALLTASWCGWTCFLGWRLAGLRRIPLGEAEPSGQFSLATMMLVVTTLAVYLGLLRAAALSWTDGFDFLAGCLLLCVPGCLLLKATADRELAWLPFATVAALWCAVLGVWWGSQAEMTIVRFMAPALVAEICFVGGTLLVLRVVGIRLVARECRSARAKSPTRAPPRRRHRTASVLSSR